MGFETFTANLTNADSPFVILEGDGISRLSIYNSSATAITATVSGTKRLNARTSDAMNIAQGVSVVLNAGQTYPLDGITITIPLNCTLSVMAN